MPIITRSNCNVSLPAGQDWLNCLILLFSFSEKKERPINAHHVCSLFLYFSLSLSIYRILCGHENKIALFCLLHKVKWPLRIQTHTHMQVNQSSAMPIERCILGTRNLIGIKIKNWMNKQNNCPQYPHWNRRFFFTMHIL